MYKNVGKSIKKLVDILVTAGITVWVAISILLAVLVFKEVDNIGEFPAELLLKFIVGIFICALMALLTWLGGLTMYAYGEIAENTAKMVKYQEEQIECMDIIIKHLEDAVFKSETEKTSKD